MPIDPRWGRLSSEAWEGLAKGWLSELNGSSKNETCQDSVVLMNFTATSEQQWSFILLAISYAQSDIELSHIAAGPVEHVLSFHGDLMIEKVELEARRSHKFKRLLSNVRQHVMNEDVWARIQEIQKNISDPLIVEEL